MVAPLWNSCDNKVIGEQINRKGSTARTEHEAHVTDIISALQKIDRDEKLPNVINRPQRFKCDTPLSPGGADEYIFGG